FKLCLSCYHHEPTAPCRCPTVLPREGHEILVLGSDEAGLASGPLLVQVTWPWASSGTSASFSCFIHKVQKSDQRQAERPRCHS
ncbi:unnamed protein product, partial [Gulo gulo]